MAALRRALALVALVATGCSVVRGAPTDGRYEGELCVATGRQAASCGPAEVRLAGGRATVRVSDIEYRLALRGDRLDMVLMHGTMQIDAFGTVYVWEDRVLRFQDPDKPVSYRVRFADPTSSGIAPTRP